MSDVTWLPVSVITDAWRTRFIFHVKQGEVRLRAKQFLLYHHRAEDRLQLQANWAIACRQHRDDALPSQLPKYDDWSRGRFRALPIISTTTYDRELFENILRPSAGLREPVPGDGEFIDAIDWETCSFLKLWGEPNMYGQRMGCSISGIEFVADTAIQIGIPIDSISGSGTDKLLQPNQATVAARRGPKVRYAWTAFEDEAIRVLVEEGGYDLHYTQSDLDDHMARWCDKFWSSSPSRTTRIEHIKKAHQRYGPP